MSVAGSYFEADALDQKLNGFYAEFQHGPPLDMQSPWVESPVRSTTFEHHDPYATPVHVGMQPQLGQPGFFSSLDGGPSSRQDHKYDSIPSVPRWSPPQSLAASASEHLNRENNDLRNQLENSRLKLEIAALRQHAQQGHTPLRAQVEPHEVVLPHANGRPRGPAARFETRIDNLGRLHELTPADHEDVASALRAKTEVPSLPFARREGPVNVPDPGMALMLKAGLGNPSQYMSDQDLIHYQFGTETFEKAKKAKGPVWRSRPSKSGTQR
jgi:hypothetical protein